MPNSRCLLFKCTWFLVLVFLKRNTPHLVTALFTTGMKFYEARKPTVATLFSSLWQTSRIPGVTRAFNFGSSLTTARACLCTRKEHDRPRQKALAPPEAQAVLWVARLAADMSDRVLWNGEARVRRHRLFLTRRVSAEVALAKTQRPPCPRQRATDWQRPNLARAGLVALM